MEKDTELIILEVLNCQDENDRKSIEYLKEHDEAFNWKLLGIYQNLIATLPSTLKLDLPTDLPKEVFKRKLNRLIFGKEDIAAPKKFVPGKKDISTEIKEEKIAEIKIEWDSLSVPDLSSQKHDGFEEVKARTTFVKKETQSSIKKTEELREDDFADFTEVSRFQPSKQKKSSILKRLVLTSSALFVIIIGISAYMIFKNEQEVVQTAVEQPTQITDMVNSDELNTDSVEIFKPIIQPVETIQTTLLATDVQKINTSEKSDNNKNTFPKAPPKLPDPIEAPLITTKEVVNDEKVKTEESSIPPPKEEIDESGEPTFFVAVEEMPQPIGGLQEIQKKIKYPEIAKRVGVEGKVFVRAFVDEEGNVVNAEVVKGIGGGCDEAALEAIRKTKFTPGKQRGKPIKVQVTVPVLFKL